MKTKYLSSALLLSLLILFWISIGFKAKPNKVSPQEDMSECLSKVKSEWGEKCLDCGELLGYHITFEETYKVFLTNVCEFPIDVKTCVQEKDGSWKCYHFEEMLGKDTMEAWACKGTGKYLKWVKKAGNHELVFPTNQEVNEQYAPED